MADPQRGPGANTPADQNARRRARLIASVTSLDLLDLRADVARLVAAGVDGLHLDVSDGAFVPFITFGLSVCAAVRRITDLPLDVHLMVEDPEPFVRELADLANTRVSFHVEASRYPWRVCSLLRKLGLQAGVAANAITPVETIAPLAATADFLHLLAADHDFAGDRPLGHAAERVARLRHSVPPSVRLELDGGIDVGNAGIFVAAGVDDLVVGRAICRQQDWTQAVRDLRAAMEQTSSGHSPEAAAGGRPGGAGQWTAWEGVGKL